MIIVALVALIWNWVMLMIFTTQYISIDSWGSEFSNTLQISSFNVHSLLFERSFFTCSINWLSKNVYKLILFTFYSPSPSCCSFTCLMICEKLIFHFLSPCFFFFFFFFAVSFSIYFRRNISGHKQFSQTFYFCTVTHQLVSQVTRISVGYVPNNWFGFRLCRIFIFTGLEYCWWVPLALLFLIIFLFCAQRSKAHFILVFYFEQVSVKLKEQFEKKLRDILTAQIILIFTLSHGEH